MSFFITFLNHLKIKKEMSSRKRRKNKTEKNTTQYFRQNIRLHFIPSHFNFARDCHLFVSVANFAHSCRIKFESISLLLLLLLLTVCALTHTHKHKTQQKNKQSSKSTSNGQRKSNYWTEILYFIFVFLCRIDRPIKISMK